MPPGTDSDRLDKGSDAGTTRAQQWYELAQTVVSEYSARDAMLAALEPYYFLDEEKDPDQAAPEDDETLEVVRLPHGTDVIDLVQSLLSNADLNISVPARSSNRRDLDLADEAERWLQAILAENDKRAGQGLLDRAAWLVAMRAAFCARVIFRPENLEKDGDTYKQGSKPAILFQVRDPLVVYPSFAEDGLSFVVEQWTRTVADIRYSWGKGLLPDKKPEDEVAWTEMWDDEEFCYWADGQPVPQAEQNGEGPWPHECGTSPYVFRFAHQTGLREPERRPRPMLEAQHHVIDYLDMLDTIELTTIREYGGDSLVYEGTRHDSFEVDFTPLAVNKIMPGEKVNWLRANRQPLDAIAARAKYDAAFQRGTFPYSLYGQDPNRIMSGFSISLLNQGGQMRMRAIVEAIESGISDLLSKALMIAEKKLAPVLDKGIVKAYVRGSHTADTGSSRTIRQEIALKAGNLDGYYEVDVSLGEIMQQDKQANLVLATRARSAGPDGRPLLSWQTTVEKFKLVESAGEERRRIDEEMFANDPEVQALRQAIFAVKSKKELVEDAEELGVDVEEVLERQRMEADALKGTGKQMATPELLPGLPSEILPPEMQGMAQSPEEMMAMMSGAPPPMGPG